MRKAIWIVPLCLLAVLAFASLMVGSSSYPAGEVVRTLLGKGGDPALSYIISSMRLPRTIAALLCGMVLATSGCLFQAVPFGHSVCSVRHEPQILHDLLKDRPDRGDRKSTRLNSSH